MFQFQFKIIAKYLSGFQLRQLSSILVIISSFSDSVGTNKIGNYLVCKMSNFLIILDESGPNDSSI